MTDFAPHISNYLKTHLPHEQGASNHTVASYAYSFQLLTCFVADRLGIRPCRIKIEQLTCECILDFLDHLERARGNTARTRNARLAAFKSFFRYLEYRVPTCLDLARQIQAIPIKRFEQALSDSLDRDELQALLDAPDVSTQAGVRDSAMLHLAYTAGLRASELVGLACDDLRQPHLDTVRLTGKGRRERELPLWKETRSVLRDWLAVRPDSTDRHLFLNARGAAMSRHGFNHRLGLHVDTARQTVPSMVNKHITPHCLRHTCALHILEATGDIRKVSLWLGHASIQSSEIYLRVDLVEKLDVLQAGLPPQIRKGAFKTAPDRLMALLNDVRSQ